MLGASHTDRDRLIVVCIAEQTTLIMPGERREVNAVMPDNAELIAYVRLSEEFAIERFNIGARAIYPFDFDNAEYISEYDGFMVRAFELKSISVYIPKDFVIGVVVRNTGHVPSEFAGAFICRVRRR